MSIKLNSVGGGSVTIQEPNTASDFTLSVPANTTTIVGTDTTQTLTNKTLTTPNINSAQVATVSGTAPLYMCRAWVNFNGQGTVSIRASGNVSSITDNGVGDFTINFATSMPDANYSFGHGLDDDGFNDAASYHVKGLNWDASSLRIRTAFAWTSNSAFADFGITTVQFFR